MIPPSHFPKIAIVLSALLAMYLSARIAKRGQESGKADLPEESKAPDTRSYAIRQAEYLQAVLDHSRPKAPVQNNFPPTPRFKNDPRTPLDAARVCAQECVARIILEFNVPLKTAMLTPDPDVCHGKFNGGAQCDDASKCQRMCGRSVANDTEQMVSVALGHFRADEATLDDLNVCEEFYGLFNNLCQQNPKDKEDCSYQWERPEDREWYTWCGSVEQEKAAERRHEPSPLSPVHSTPSIDVQKPTTEEELMASKRTKVASKVALAQAAQDIAEAEKLCYDFTSLASCKAKLKNGEIVGQGKKGRTHKMTDEVEACLGFAACAGKTNLPSHFRCEVQASVFHFLKVGDDPCSSQEWMDGMNGKGNITEQCQRAWELDATHGTSIAAAVCTAVSTVLPFVHKTTGGDSVWEKTD